MMHRSSRILIIDDDKWLCDQIGHVLLKVGYTVDIAWDALEGMARIDKRAPDVIILDLFMPGPNGIVLLHEIQSHSDLATIPIILCTNSASDLSQDMIAPYGVVRVLDKTTMKPNDLMAAVAGVL